MKIAVVTARSVSGDTGGAERFFDALVGAFRMTGHEAHEVPVFADESNFDQIKRNYLRCYDLDLAKFDLVVSTKAPTWLIRHPRHVCYLVHTIRVFYDMFEETFPAASREVLAQRELVQALDTGALTWPRCRAVFSIGAEVSQRLSEYNHLEAEVMHPPLWGNGFWQGLSSEYFFLPGRLHPWKRVDLAIRAMRHLAARVPLLIAGSGEAETSLRELAEGDPRIAFLGRVSDKRVRELYANALAIPYLPKREDFGYVTLEAFASGKPVITCEDSGEPAKIVRDSSGGLVVPPKPESVALAMTEIHRDREGAAAMGRAGREWTLKQSWAGIAQRLVDAGMSGEPG